MAFLKRLRAIIPPKAPSGGEVEQTDLLNYLRKCVEALKQDSDDQDAAIGFDHRNEIEVMSEGVGREVRIPHQLGFIPARMSVVDPGDFDGGSVYRSKPDLGDENFIYVKTSAPRGTKFVVVVKPSRSQ